MAMSKEQIAGLKTNIGFARKRDLAFGLCLGKKPETTLLVCHKTKDPSILGRQAKKDGETNKFTFGKMSCKGKNLNLTCTGDVPAGLARRVKDMFKSAGLPLRVVILDPAGGTLESDGEGDDEEENKSARPRSEAEPEVVAEKPQPSPTAPEAAGNTSSATEETPADTKAEGVSDDAPAAPGDDEPAVAELEKRRKQWEAALEKLQPHVDNILENELGNAKKIDALWNLAKSKATATPPNFSVALKSVTVVAKLVAEARAEAPQSAAPPEPAMAGDRDDAAGPGPTSAPEPAVDAPSEKGGDTPAEAVQPAAGDVTPEPTAPPDLTGDKDARIARADKRLTDIAGLIKAYTGMMSSLAEPAPTGWATEIKRIKDALTPMRPAEAAEDKAALDKLLNDVTVLETTIRAETAKKKTFEQAYDLFGVHLIPLDNHPQKAKAPEVKPHIDAIKADRDKALAKAKTHDFAGAQAELPKLAKRCEEVEILADDYSHYAVILAQRTTAVGLSAGPVTGTADVDDLQTKMEGLLTAAAADATAGKFNDGVKKLDQIPDLARKMLLLGKAAKDYASWIPWCDGKLAAVDAKPEADRKPYQKSIDDFKKLYADAKFAKTKDYYKSILMLKKINLHRVYFEDGINNSAAYNALVATYKTQLATFKAHGGKAGIESYILQMEADLISAEAEAKTLKHATATSILNQHTAAKFTAQTQQAVDYLAFVTKRDAVATKIKTERKRPAARALLEQADALMATAVGHALTPDYTKALASVTEAEVRCTAAKGAADAQDALGALKDTGALDKMATDFEAAFKVFTDMKSHVAGLDTTSALATLIATADAPSAAARTSATKAKPDFGTARTKLDGAIAILEDAQGKLSAMGQFASDLAAAKTRVSTTLPAADADGCLTAQLAKATALLDEAENLAKAPGFDFAKAGVKVLDAQKIADLASVNIGIWATIKTNRATIMTEIGTINGNAPIKAAMPKRLARLNKYIADTDGLITAANFKEADALAKEGAAVATATVQDRTDCAATLLRKTSWYDANTTTIGTPIPAPATNPVAEATALFKIYLGYMVNENFSAGGAFEAIRAANWPLVVAIRTIAADGTYQPKKTAAAAAIKTVSDIRNAGVETELLAIEVRFTAADKQAVAGDHAKAGAEMDKITAECPALKTKARAFKAYDNARIAAIAKLTEAEGHEQADAVRPILVRLVGKRDKAIQAATAGDVAEAKRLMDEVKSGANEALSSAGRAEIVDGISDKLESWTSKDGPNFVVLKAAEALFAGLAAMKEAPAAKAELDQAKAQLALAKAGGASAAAAMKAAMAACDAADSVMRQYTFLMQSVKAAQVRITKLKSHAEKETIAVELAAIDSGVTAVETSTASDGTFDLPTANLEALLVRLTTAEKTADNHAEYLALRSSGEVEPRLEVLEKHNHRYAIKANIDTLRAKLAEAESKATEHKHEEAIKLLEEFKALGISSLVLADMRENKPPKPADIKAILARPDGSAELDAMVDALEPDAQRAVLRVAFEARFGCKLQNFVDTAQTTPNPDGTQTGPDIRRFYEVMSELPQSDTLENESMVLFTNLEGPSVSPSPGVADPNAGSRYGGSKKEVIMHEGREHLSGAYRFGLDHETGEVEDRCEPENEEEVNFFSWNTLHEVGHAVDDKHNFMASKGKGSDYGGWIEHRANFTPVAEAIAKEFKYDKVYIVQVMSGNANAAKPEIPSGDKCTPEEWESRRLRALGFLSVAASTAKPWRSASSMERLKLGDRIYLESYAGYWTSYDAKARTRAITGYQFRAPGEWFSELYAAFHSGKLKKAHPSYKWLSEL